MGLSAPKRRSKISHDPNNTNWSRSESNFGQKILCAQGWKPGDYLGARNANHADHYSAANASHIKVLLREDNLGLGAQVGKGNAETFGLSLYSGVLSRLNGKSDAEVEKQQRALKDAELRNYQTHKYGLMNFVRGGLLVGDKIQPVEEQKVDMGRKRRSEEVVDPVEQKTKKQKMKSTLPPDVPSQTTMSSEGSAEEVGLDLKKKERSEGNKRKERKQDTSLESTSTKKATSPQESTTHTHQSSSSEVSDDVNVTVTSKRSKKEKKRKQKRQHDESETERDRRARKEERRRMKKEKRRSESKSQHSTPMTPLSGNTSASDSRPTSSLSVMSGNRHAVRQRYIHQKRMASLDPQAMREIFMMKTTA